MRGGVKRASNGVSAARIGLMKRRGCPMRQWGRSLARRDDVDERREKTLPEFLELMDDYRPVVRPQ